MSENNPGKDNAAKPADVTLDDILKTVSGASASDALNVLAQYLPHVEARLAEYKSMQAIYEKRISEKDEKIRQLEASLQETHARAETAEESALKDPKTGAYNDRYMHSRLEDELKRRKAYSQPVTVVMIDIDHFKKFNDNYGHFAGDYVLKEMVSVIKSHKRKVDAVCRFGGEEFTIILPQCDEPASRLVAEKFRQAVEGHDFEYSPHDGSEPVHLKVTVSVGYATALPDEPVTPQQLIARADEALYHSKNAGGRNVTTLWKKGSGFEIIN